MHHKLSSVYDMDIIQKGLLRRMDTREPPYTYTLRDYGVLECTETSLSLTLLHATIVKNQADQTLLITDANNYSIMLQADTPTSFNIWANALSAMTTESDYRVGHDVIAKTDNSTVFRGVRERDGVAVAVKAVSRKRRPNSAMTESHMSRYLSRAAREGYPVGLVRCLATYHTKNETHSVMEAVGMSMESVGMSLEAWVAKNGVLSDSAAKSVVAQLITGLEFLHRRSIIHCGVAAENVLIAGVVSGDLQVKLGGFSKACVKMDDGWGPRRGYDELKRCSKGVYTAPEVVTRGIVGPCTDFWGLGVLLYRCLVGRLPFCHADDSIEQSEDGMLEYSNLQRSDLRRKVLFPDGDAATKNLSADARSFLATLLMPRLEERMGARCMMRHPWLLLARIPVKRRSGSDSPVDVFVRGISR